MNYPWTKYITRKKKEFMIFFKGRDVPGLTAEDWVEYKKVVKKNFKFSYKLVDFLEDVEMFLNRQWDKIESPRYYIRNRFINKTHYLPTGLKPGQWHDTREQIFHGVMKQIVYFYEVENASETQWYFGEEGDEEEKKNFPEHQVKRLEVTREAYIWYTKTYPEYLKLADELYDVMITREIEDDNLMSRFTKDVDQERESQHRDIRNTLHQIEKIMEEQKVEILKKIMEVSPDLWS